MDQRNFELESEHRSSDYGSAFDALVAALGATDAAKMMACGVGTDLIELGQGLVQLDNLHRGRVREELVDAFIDAGIAYGMAIQLELDNRDASRKNERQN